MQKAFRRYPIELAACADLQDKEKERQFFEDCKMHFEHIREVVTETFHAPGYVMDKRDAVLEPSYICTLLFSFGSTLLRILYSSPLPDFISMNDDISRCI